MTLLLAVDLGFKSGLALFGQDGRLCWYRSSNFGARNRLKKAIPGILRGVEGLSWLVAEGDRGLGELWTHEAGKRGAKTILIGAEVWRRQLLFAREQRSGAGAKHSADKLARALIAWSGLPKPKALRHDAAEAIMVGFWGVLEVGWITSVPDEIARGGVTAKGPFGARASLATG